jgi:DNA-binding NarL/FixJ family response regulator
MEVTLQGQVDMKHFNLKPGSQAEQSIIHLTVREVEVAKLVAYGASNKRIAQKLGISDFTVRDHVSRLLRKFEVDSRTRLAVVLSAGF